MLKIFKLLIPSSKHKVEIDEVQTYTVEWKYLTGWSENKHTKFKTFTSEEDAELFKEALENSADLIGCWLSVKKYKN